MRVSGHVVLGAALLSACGSASKGGGADVTASGGTPSSPGTTGIPQTPAAGTCSRSSGKRIGVPVVPATRGTSASRSTAGTTGTPAPLACCLGLTAPPPIAMEQHVVVPSGPPVVCRAAVGDANGTLAFPTVYTYAMAHGSSIEFMTTAGELLGDYGTGDDVRLLQQPQGFAATATPRYGPPIIRQLRWDYEGRSLMDGSWWIAGTPFQEAAAPNGGVLVAGDLSPTDLGSIQHAAVMFEGGGVPYGVRWGPAPLASSGAVLGVGVDVLGRAIVMTDGSTRFAPGAVSAQWFDRDGTAMTGDFLLIGRTIADPCAYTWLETSPLIGGGVAVRLMSTLSGTFVEAHALAVVLSGSDTVQPAPDWMTDRPGTRLEIVRGGMGYAVLPYGAPDVECTQRIELLAPDGASCGSIDFQISAGTCDTGELSLAEDGTVVQQLPLSMETALDTGPGNPHTCTWRYWPQALR